MKKSWFLSSNYTVVKASSVSIWSRFSLLAVALIMGFVACSEKIDKGPVKVRIAMPDERGNYKFQTVPLTTIDSLEKATGAAARIVINANAIDEHQVNSGKNEEPKYRYTLLGETPALDFIKDKNNVYHPTSYLAYELTAVYAHFERLMQMNKKLEVDGMLNFPAQISTDLVIFGDDSVIDSDNAFYVPGYSFFGFVPYSLEGFSTSVNGGIIAHEYFHSIFDKVFSQSFVPDIELHDLPSFSIKSKDNKNIFQHQKHPETSTLNTAKSLKDHKCADGNFTNDVSDEEFAVLQTYFFNEFFVKSAINEGMADVLAWLYTNDSDFMRKTFSSDRVAMPRNLGLDQPTSLATSEGFSGKSLFQDVDTLLNKQQNCRSELVGLSYLLGTRLARIYKRILIELFVPNKKVDFQDQEVRLLMGKHLIGFIKRFSQSYKRAQRMDIDSILDLMYAPGEEKQEICNIIDLNRRNHKSKSLCAQKLESSKQVAEDSKKQIDNIPFDPIPSPKLAEKSDEEVANKKEQ